MNIELDEVVVQDVSDDALEMAAGGNLSIATYGPSPYGDARGVFSVGLDAPIVGLPRF